MRVAIFALSSLGIAVSSVSSAQGLQAAEATAFNSAVPAVVAMNSPGFGAPELVVPAIPRPALRRGVSGHPTNAAAAGASLRTVPSVAAANLVRSGGGMRSLHRSLDTPQRPRAFTDHLLAGVVALMLIAYQLRRKHRVLRPQPFTI